MPKTKPLLIILAGIAVLAFALAAFQLTRPQKQNPPATTWNQNQNPTTEAQIQPLATPEQPKPETINPKEARLTGTGCFIDEYKQKFREDFNLNQADTTVTYTNAAKGISFEIPYNSKWGNKECEVEPYSEFSYDENTGPNILFFGQPSAGPDEFSLEFLAPKTANDTLAEIKEANSNSGAKIVHHDNLEAVEYLDFGVSEFFHVEVIGPKNNYLFTTEANNKKNLQAVVNTAKLVD